jgi:hypothetical protein
VIGLSKSHLQALTRSDLSSVVVHFTQDPKIVNGNFIHPFDVLLKILEEGKVLASDATKVNDPRGASCFYDVPYHIWRELMEKSPKKIRGYGIIVWKVIFWHLGGRPAIYTEYPTYSEWPPKERFRLVPTDFCRQPDPIDWTHEREWRFPGDFPGDFDIFFARSKIENFWMKYKSYWEWPYDYWWWPCVERLGDAQRLCQKCYKVDTIYVMETRNFYNVKNIV